MTHSQNRQDVYLTQNLLVDVGWPLRDHCHSHDAALFHQPAYRYQAELLRFTLHRLRSEGVRLKLPKNIRDIAWKAQTRLCTRYRSIVARGKKPTVVVTAIARELAGFTWAIGQEMRTQTTT